MNVSVEYEQKSAVVRFLPTKVGLKDIIGRYDDTPFDVTQAKPIVSVLRLEHATLRGWVERPALPPNKGRQNLKRQGRDTTPRSLSLVVEVAPAKAVTIDQKLQLSTLDPPAAGLKLVSRFAPAKGPRQLKAKRFVARLSQLAPLKPGKMLLPVSYEMTAVNADKTRQTVKGRLQVILRTAPAPDADRGKSATGIALVNGSLELRLGHLCNQRGCVEHFHRSLEAIRGLAAVQPHAKLKNPRATAYLRAGHAVDVWSLRERLRDRGVEVRGIVPQDLSGYRLRVELPRWRFAKTSKASEKWAALRGRITHALESSELTKRVRVAGGGMNVELTKSKCDLVRLLDAIAETGTAPLAVWLVPKGVRMPKTSPARVPLAGGEKAGGSNADPQIEFEFGSSEDADAHILALVGQSRWAARIKCQTTAKTSVVRVAIAPRKYAEVQSLSRKFQAAGRVPRQIRLVNFGDIRVQIEFAHICGDIEYSKPRKRKSKSRKKTAKPRKPFVPATAQAG